MLRRIFDIFRIRKEERLPAIVWLAMLVIVNALVINRYYTQFSQVADNYRSIVIRAFHLSGFDPLTYVLVTDWSPAYNIYRHPLLAFFMYLPYGINQGLIALTGINCAQFVVAAFLIFSAFYSLVFLYRTFKEIILLGHRDACILSFMTYSFAFVMVASCAPDHFILSMLLLILTVCVSGRKMRKGKPYTIWQTILFFFLTAGISLNNGIKVFLANMLTNVRKFFRPVNLVFAIFLPAIALWFIARMEWKHYEYPHFHARQVAKVKKRSAERTAIYNMVRDTMRSKDSADIAQEVDRVLKLRALEKYQKRQQIPSVAHAGKPMGKGEFSQWTDMTTDRWQSAVDNLFGESIQLHPDYLLGDTLVKRPVFVAYRYWANYVVEAIIVALFLAGIWCGRRSRFLWLCLSFFLFDMLIHFVLGFGLNEIYIMSPHFLFVIPVAIAFLLRQAQGKRWHRPLSGLCALLALALTIYNGSLLIYYLTCA